MLEDDDWQVLTSCNGKVANDVKACFFMCFVFMRFQYWDTSRLNQVRPCYILFVVPCVCFKDGKV